MVCPAGQVARWPEAGKRRRLCSAERAVLVTMQALKRKLSGGGARGLVSDDEEEEEEEEDDGLYVSAVGRNKGVKLKRAKTGGDSEGVCVGGWGGGGGGGGGGAPRAFALGGHLGG